MQRPALALLLLASLAACSTTNPDVIRREDAQRLSSVLDATVLSVRPVRVDGDQSGVGSVTGAVVGGVAGSSVGGHREAVAVGVIGAVAGAVLGNAIERNVTQEDAVEILVQLRNGERRAIVQAQGSEQLAAGDPVIIVTTGHRVRVARAPAGTVAAPAPVPATVAPAASSGMPAPIYTPR